MILIHPFSLFFKVCEMHHHPFQSVPPVVHLKFYRSFLCMRPFAGFVFEFFCGRNTPHNPGEIDDSAVPASGTYESELIILFGIL